MRHLDSWVMFVVMSRAYRRAQKDQRKAARQAARACRVTGNPTVDNAALAWRIQLTVGMTVLALVFFGLGGNLLATGDPRGVVLIIVGIIDSVSAVRSLVMLISLMGHRRP